MIIGNNAEQFALPKVLASQYPIVFYGRPSLDNAENSSFSALYHDDQQGGQLAYSIWPNKAAGTLPFEVATGKA